MRSNVQSQNTRPRQIAHDRLNRSNPPSQRRRQKRLNRQKRRYGAISKHCTQDDDGCFVVSFSRYRTSDSYTDCKYQTRFLIIGKFDVFLG